MVQSGEKSGELYQSFLDKLQGSFSEFVQSEEVNAYLQTIGGDIKTQVLEGGVFYMKFSQ